MMNFTFGNLYSKFQTFQTQSRLSSMQIAQFKKPLFKELNIINLSSHDLEMEIMTLWFVHNLYVSCIDIMC
jgi:hypothetical protein